MHILFVVIYPGKTLIFSSDMYTPMKKKFELQDMNSYKFQPNVCFGLERIDLVATQGQGYQVNPGLVVNKTDARNNMYNTYEHKSVYFLRSSGTTGYDAHVATPVARLPQ